MTIRPITALALLCLAAAPAAAQQHDHGAQHGAAQQHAAGGWKEMDAFHQLMMATWHPASGKNDLAPARAKAGELAAAARAWKAAAVPRACDTPATRTAVAKVAADADAFAALAAQAGTTDAALKAALKGVHDAFEPVEEGCAPGGPVKKDAHAGHRP